MFTIANNWLMPDPKHAIFDFHLPNYPVVPGAISAGLLYQAYFEQLESLDQSVDILFQKPITKETKLKLSVVSNRAGLINENDEVLVQLVPTKSSKKPETLKLNKIQKQISRIIRPPELIFHNHFNYDKNTAECTLHYEDLLKNRSYLSSLKQVGYFILLETMGNLAMELCVPNVQEVFIFHSFKGIWFDWTKITGELTITTYARRLNSQIIQWNSQVKNKNQNLVGYVNMGLSIKKASK